MHLFVGSTNPVKLNAVTIAASEAWPDAIVTGLEVPSGIAEQPMSDEETRQGAINRAKRVLELGLRQIEQKDGTSENFDSQTQSAQNPNSANPNTTALGVGLEGGVFLKENELWSTVWVAVADGEGNVFESNGARFKLPDQFAQPILAGQAMGEVGGTLTLDPELKKKQGMIGLVTSGFVDRTEEYAVIAKLALGLWFGRNWYDELHKI